MPPSIGDQVVDFYAELFERVFSSRFRDAISDRLRSRAVLRQVSEAADAASQSLTRFFLNQQLPEASVADILAGLDGLGELLDLSRIANPNVAPESLAEELLVALPVPAPLRETDHEAVYRVALHSILQVLLLVGPVMGEWQKLEFSSTFELPRRVVGRLNQISEQIEVLSRAGQSAADERFELTYRDYLLQRFHRVEAGTVRMTTNLDVDLRELFVMPRVEQRACKLPGIGETASAGLPSLVTSFDFLSQVPSSAFLSLAAAWKIFTSQPGSKMAADGAEQGLSALEQFKNSARMVLIGLPAAASPPSWNGCSSSSRLSRRSWCWPASRRFLSSSASAS